jgi:MFS family permease
MNINIQLVINRTIQILLFYLFVVNASASLFAPIFAVFVTQAIVGATLATVGFTIATYAIVKSLVQIPVAHSLDHRRGEMDDFHTLIFGSFLGIVYMFTLIYINQPWQLYALSVVSGVSDGLLMAAYYSIFSHHVDRRSQAFEWSLLSVGGMTISVALGGAIGGVLAEHIGFPALFFIAGICNSIATIMLFSLYPYLKRKKN